MKRYTVTLEQSEREALEGITRKGAHRPQKVINALVLLNCDEGAFNERRSTGTALAEVLRISLRRVDRVKKRFVEVGLEAALGGRQGRRPTYRRKADGAFEARLIALSCGDPPAGHAQWSLRLLADRVVELGYIDSVSHETVRRVLKKNELKPWKRVGWVIPPQRNGHFVAAMERVLEVYRRPYDPAYPVVCMDGDAPSVDPRDARADPGAPRTARAPRLRVPALRGVQRLHGHRTVGRQAPDQGDRTQDQDRLGRTFSPISPRTTPTPGQSPWSWTI